MPKSEFLVAAKNAEGEVLGYIAPHGKHPKEGQWVTAQKARRLRKSVATGLADIWNNYAETRDGRDKLPGIRFEVRDAAEEGVF